MMCAKRITIELNEEAAAAFEMMLADCSNADPGARWTPEALARSMLVSILEDDLASRERSALPN